MGTIVTIFIHGAELKHVKLVPILSNTFLLKKDGHPFEFNLIHTSNSNTTRQDKGEAD